MLPNKCIGVYHHEIGHTELKRLLEHSEEGSYIIDVVGKTPFVNFYKKELLAVFRLSQVVTKSLAGFKLPKNVTAELVLLGCIIDKEYLPGERPDDKIN